MHLVKCKSRSNVWLETFQWRGSDDTKHNKERRWVDWINKLITLNTLEKKIKKRNNYHHKEVIWYYNPDLEHRSHLLHLTNLFFFENNRLPHTYQAVATMHTTIFSVMFRFFSAFFEKLKIRNMFSHPVRVLLLLCFVSSLSRKKNIFDNALPCDFTISRYTLFLLQLCNRCAETPCVCMAIYVKGQESRKLTLKIVPCVSRNRIWDKIDLVKENLLL